MLVVIELPNLMDEFKPTSTTLPPKNQIYTVK